MKTTMRILLVILILICTLTVLEAAPAAERETQTLYVRSYDGAYIPVAVSKPAGDGPFPAILFIHGGVGGSGPKALPTLSWVYHSGG